MKRRCRECGRRRGPRAGAEAVLRLVVGPDCPSDPATMAGALGRDPGFLRAAAGLLLEDRDQSRLAAANDHAADHGL